MFANYEHVTYPKFHLERTLQWSDKKENDSKTLCRGKLKI